MTEAKSLRYLGAQAQLPGDRVFWEALVNESDIFAYGTANTGKGGPFGAQLWLVHPETNTYMLVGEAKNAQDSNAVISKGIGSAHAEAENLSPEKRQKIIDFLQKDRRKDWHVVQVSSGESCPSCRSKQVLFANELFREKLLIPGNFHVAFKATYDQTKNDAGPGFNDAAYDETFRAIAAHGMCGRPDGLFKLESEFKKTQPTSRQIKSGDLIYNPVDLVESANIPAAVNELFLEAGEIPFAVIVRPDGSILSSAQDERDRSMLAELIHKYLIDMPEKTAIVSALHKAATYRREKENIKASWNLEGAILYTNIRDIGPLAYSESLWYNLAGIKVVRDYTNPDINLMAWEVYDTDNTTVFAQVAAEYDAPNSVLKVTYLGDPNEASVAHLLWKAMMAREGLQQRQADRVEALEKTAGQRTVQYLGGEPLVISELVTSSRDSNNYDGKRAAPEPRPAKG